MLRKQKNDKLEQMQKKFSEQQELNRLTIVEKILKEENEKDRKRKLNPELYKTTHKPSSNIPSPPIKQKENSQINLTQTETSADVTTTQVVPTSQLDIDHIEYASSMTSVYQHDEFDDGEMSLFYLF
jgi:hypothetical protein